MVNGEGILDLLSEIRDRIAKIENVVTEQSTAFVRNDLGKPDYDGHRKAHISQIKAAEVMDGYKIETTKKIIGVIVVFLLGLFGSGFISHIPGWVK